jgi:hypothetical protein
MIDLIQDYKMCGIFCVEKCLKCADFTTLEYVKLTKVLEQFGANTSCALDAHAVDEAELDVGVLG